MSKSGKSSGSSKFGPGWGAWWRGDEIHAAFAKNVEKALRVLAYETQQKARARIIRRGWGSEWKQKNHKNGKYRGRLAEIKKTIDVWRKTKGVKSKKYRLKILNGQLMRLTKVRYYRPSRPGESPTNQRGVLRNSILYDFRKSAGMVETIVGAIAMQGRGSFSQAGNSKTSHWSMTDGLATHALEHGGWSRNHGGKMVRIAARPFMRPAAEEVIREASILQKQLHNSVNRGFAKSPPGIGWSKS